MSIAHLALEPNIGVLLLFGCAFCVAAFAVATWLDKRTPLLAALWLGLVGISHGQTRAERHSNIAQGTVGVRVGKSHGSGTVVSAADGKAIIVTCAHVFRDEPNVPPLIDLFAPVPGVLNAKPLTINYQSDVAVIEAQLGAFKAAPIAVAPRDARMQVGDTVDNSGCGHSGAPTVLRTAIESVNRFVGPSNFCMVGAQEQGRSGGGVFSRGYLCGVIQASDGRMGLAGGLLSIHTELARAGLKETQYCEGGSCGIGGGGYTGGPPMAPQNMAPVAPQQAQTDPRLDDLIRSYNGTVDYINKLGKQPGCQCKPMDLSGIETRLSELEKQLAVLASRPVPDCSEQIKALEAAIKLAKCKCAKPSTVEPQKPAPVQSSPSGPASYDIRRRKTGAT
ncbi:MAG: serine protease [Pirellulales bacterium]